MNRRDFLKGIGGILAASQAPAFVQAVNLMPVRQLDSGLYAPNYVAIYSGNNIVRRLPLVATETAETLVYDLVDPSTSFRMDTTITDLRFVLGDQGGLSQRMDWQGPVVINKGDTLTIVPGGKSAVICSYG